MNRRRPRNTPSRPVIFVVAEHDDTRELYVAGLTTLGFEANGVADSKQTLRMAWECHPDTIVVDLPPGGIVGGELIESLTRVPRTRDIPIILLVDQVTPALREGAESGSYAAILVKPCLPDELATELRHVLERTLSHERVSVSD